MNKNILLAISLFFLLFFTGLAIYSGRVPRGAAFHEENYDFFQSLTDDHSVQPVQVSRLDAYYKDNWYYYDVTFTAGADEQRRVYYGFHSFRGENSGSFDPDVLAASKNREDIDLFLSWQSAAEHGTHKSFDLATIQSYLDEVYDR